MLPTIADGNIISRKTSERFRSSVGSITFQDLSRDVSRLTDVTSAHVGLSKSIIFIGRVAIPAGARVKKKKENKRHGKGKRKRETRAPSIFSPLSRSFSSGRAAKIMREYPGVTSNSRESLASILPPAIPVMFHFGSKESRRSEGKYCSMHSGAETGCIPAHALHPRARTCLSAAAAAAGTKAKVTEGGCTSMY